MVLLYFKMGGKVVMLETSASYLFYVPSIHFSFDSSPSSTIIFSISFIFFGYKQNDDIKFVSNEVFF